VSGEQQIAAGGEFIAECRSCGTASEFIAQGGESVGDEQKNHCSSCDEPTEHEVTELQATRVGRIYDE